MILAEVEAQLGVTIADHFDLIAGTSTGGLIALGLGAGLSPADIVEFYTRHGEHIFGRPRRISRLWRPSTDLPGSAPRSRRYSATGCSGRASNGSSSRRSASTSTTSTSSRRDATNGLTRDHTPRMVDVAMATAAAPT